MPLELQKIFRVRAKARHLWAGGRVATSQDLAAFFVARSVELYLRIGGRFGFVMPLATLLGEAYEGFRQGDFSSVSEECAVSFKVPWDLEQVDPKPFPVPSCVVFGLRAASSSHKDRLPMPSARMRGSGNVASGAPEGGEDGLSLVLDSQAVGAVKRPRNSASPYGTRFRQGAALVPRMLILVVTDAPGPLPVPKTLRAVHSRRGSLEKKPWSELPAQKGVVESIFVRPAYLGEHVLPFGLWASATAVVPFDGKHMLSGDDERIDRYPKFAGWWRAAEAQWDEHKADGSLRTLTEQVDYQGKLSAQLPATDLRVVYTTSGSYLASAIVDDSRAVIDMSLNWAAVSSLSEGRYLEAVINSSVLGKLVLPYQNRGAFGPRHFAKLLWRLPVPEFDASNELHQRLVDLAERAEGVESIVSAEIDGHAHFQRARGVVRETLVTAGIADQLDAAVTELLGH